MDNSLSLLNILIGCAIIGGGIVAAAWFFGITHEAGLYLLIGLVALIVIAVAYLILQSRKEAGTLERP
ncbi:MAG: hypothetical protein EHJ95_03750 [Methanobacteriota archaeon]|nr:MAG: hypothetical protein EHJ95_03750 [Euryarchaeota archaeon]